MAVDWTDDIKGAREDIAENGRLVSFVKRATAIDPANPLGASPASSTLPNVPAVFVYPSGLVHLGMSKEKRAQFNSCDQICLVASVETGEILSDYDYLVDDGSDWEIVTSETLKPGTDIIIYYIGVKRA